MTTNGPMDLLDLAEDVAAGRMTAAEAELAIRSTGNDEGAVAELRGLVAAATAVRRHAAVFRESTLGSDPTRVPTTDSATNPVAVAIPTIRRGRTLAGRSAGRRRPGLLIAATLAVAGGTIGAAIMGTSLPPNPLPTPGPSLVVAPTTVPIVVPGDGVDAFGTKPGAVVWHTVAPDRIEIMAWHSGIRNGPRAFQVETLPFASHPKREVLAAPSGEWFAISEWGLGSVEPRLRVVDTVGFVVWSTSAHDHVSWSTDGSRLALSARGGRSWTVVTLAAAEEPRVLEYDLPGDDPTYLAGFSVDGHHLLGWAGDSLTGGFDIDLDSAAARPFDRFPTGSTGLAVSNRSGYGRWFDPISARWLSPEDGWTLYSDGSPQSLRLPVHEGWEWTDAMWAGDGSLLLLETSLDTEPPSNSQLDPVVWRMAAPAPGGVIEALGPVIWPYMGPFGTRSRAAFLATGGGAVLIGLSVAPVPDDAGTGWDDFNLRPLAGTGFGSMALEGMGAFDMHPGGLVRQP